MFAQAVKNPNLVALLTFSFPLDEGCKHLTKFFRAQKMLFLPSPMVTAILTVHNKLAVSCRNNIAARKMFAGPDCSVGNMVCSSPKAERAVNEETH